MKRKRTATAGRIVKRRRFNPPRNIIRYQQRHPGGEIKSIDVVNAANGAAQVAFTLNTTQQITPLNILTLGNSMFNRSGRKVTMKSIYIQGCLIGVNTPALPAVQFARIALVYDKQPNGALPAFGDIFRDQINQTGGDISLTPPTAGVNLNNRDRFEIILDKRFSLPAGDFVITTAGEPMHVEWFKKLNNREVHYKADTAPGVIGDVATGSLLLVTFGNLAAGAEYFGLLASIRLRFSDL